MSSEFYIVDMKLKLLPLADYPGVEKTDPLLDGPSHLVCGAHEVGVR